jgi:hypothetical protein
MRLGRINRRKAQRDGFVITVAVLLGLGLLFAFGCGQYQASMPPPPGAPAVAVSFCNQTESGCAAGGSFTSSGTRSLSVGLEWQNLSAGTHSQKVSFVMPSGDEYQSFETSFVVEDGASAPVKLSQELPIEGTWIAQRRLTGMWQVNYFLDGQPMGSQAVQITQ